MADSVNRQFPSKFTALPDIAGLSSSLPQISDTRLLANDDNRLVPYQGRRQDLDLNDRFSNLENKISVTERSNRVLLEEVVRLQSELKNSSRRAEDAIRDERNSRVALENTLRTNNDLISHLQLRLKRHEDKVNNDYTLVSDLVSQSKSLERSVLNNQQDFARRDIQSTKLEEMQRDLEEAIRGKNQLERVTYQMQDEIRLMKSRMDSEVGELSVTAKDLRGWSKKLEDDYRQTVTSVRKQSESTSQVGVSTAQLRSQVETRLSELRDVVMDLRNRQDHEAQERRTMDSVIQKRFHEMQTSLSDQIRQREEAIHALDASTREKEHATETERLRMQSRLSDLVEELGKKVTRKELKLREDTQERFIQLEKLIHEEKSDRLDKQRTIENNLEQTIDGLRKKQNDDINLMKEANRVDKAKMNETLKKLDVAVTILEEQIASGQKQVDKLLTAEIKSRKQHERDTRERVDHLQEKLGVATATLQEAIGGINSQVSGLADQVRRDLSSKLDERHSAALRHLNDLDTRLLSFNAKLTQMEDKMDGRISAASTTLSENMREKMKDVIFRFDSLSKLVEEMKRNNDQLPRDVYELGDKLALLREDLDVRLKLEIENRVTDVEEVRRELIKFSQGESLATMKDIDKCQATIRRLGETIQTVKAVLGMKIQHEEKSRIEEVIEIRDDVSELRGMIEPFLENTAPRVFIKPDEGTMSKYEAETNAPPLNKWSFHSAVKWVDYKQKWMNALERAKKDNSNSNQAPETQSQASGSKPLSPKRTPTPKAQTPDKPAEDPKDDDPPKDDGDDKKDDDDKPPDDQAGAEAPKNDDINNV